MATNTTNIGLKKPASTEPASIVDINQNMDIIDSKIGPVGSTSLQQQIINNLALSPKFQSANLNSGGSITSEAYSVMAIVFCGRGGNDQAIYYADNWNQVRALVSPTSNSSFTVTASNKRVTVQNNVGAYISVAILLF